LDRRREEQFRNIDREQSLNILHHLTTFGCASAIIVFGSNASMAEDYESFRSNTAKKRTAERLH
jgi:hypothetical protein